LNERFGTKKLWNLGRVGGGVPRRKSEVGGDKSHGAQRVVWRLDAYLLAFVVVGQRALSVRQHNMQCVAIALRFIKNKIDPRVSSLNIVFERHVRGAVSVPLLTLSASVVFHG
jgi:hypothetical protein